MARPVLAAVLVLAALLSACMPPPKRADQLGLPPAAPELSLVVVPTENTRNMIEFNRTHSRMTNPFDQVSQLAKEQPMNTFVGSLIYNFKSVVKVDSLNQAKAVDADLVGMMDYYFDYTVTRHLFTRHPYQGHVRIEEKLLLLDRSGRQVASIAAAGDRDYGEVMDHWNPFTHFGVNPMAYVFNEVQNEVVENFARALRDSPELRAFRPSAAPAAAVAAAPEKESFRSDADVPRYKKEADPERFALVVGVEDYQSLPAARFAERDARAVRDHLAALGYPERNVVLLTGRAAGKAGLEKYLKSWLPRNAGEKSRVLVYFAGHGAPDPKTGDPYLMPWDGDARFLDTTAYPVKRLYKELAGLRSKSVLVALDAGFSGAGGRSVIAKGARPLVTSAEAGLPVSDKLTVLLAATGDEAAGTEAAQGHGLFTYRLLEALQDARGAAGSRELFADLKPKVQDAARSEGRDQTPRLLPVTGGSDPTP